MIHPPFFFFFLSRQDIEKNSPISTRLGLVGLIDYLPGFAANTGEALEENCKIFEFFDRCALYVFLFFCIAVKHTFFPLDNEIEMPDISLNMNDSIQMLPKMFWENFLRLINVIY